MPSIEKTINKVKKATVSSKRAKGTSSVSKSKTVIKKSTTSTSLFAQKVQSANELLQNVQLITRGAIISK